MTTTDNGDGSELLFEAPTARVILSECHYALNKLQEKPGGRDWRILWVATHSLLRTVANVFGTVDAKDEMVHPEMQKELSDFFDRMNDTKPKPEIYWDFIRDHTNDILHHWKFSAVQRSVRVLPLTNIRADGNTLVVQVDTSGRSTELVENAGSVEKRPVHAEWIKSGPFKNRVPREVVKEAIEWYESEIAEMIERAKAR